MHIRRGARINLVSACVPAILAMLIWPSHSRAQSPPNTIRLESTVWDFKAGHPDFGVTPNGGNGHYAGNVQLNLSGTGRPLFNGNGYRVVNQWRDKNAKNIAPHLYHNGGTMLMGSAPQTATGVVIDSWDSTAGAYGGGNVGSMPPMQYPAAMPTITAPTGLPQTYGPNPSFTGTVTFNASFRASSFTSGQGATININGNVVISISGVTSIAKNTKILLLPNSTLTFYGGSDITIGQASEINMNTFVPGKCVIYNLSNKPIVFNQNGKVCAHVISPAGNMHLKQNDHFYGKFIGSQLILDQDSGFHWDGIPMTACGSLVTDQLGNAGVASTGGISNAASFQQWYADSLGTNLSGKHMLELTRNADGVYEYLEDQFHPIDNQLFGNEGQAHNLYFTMAIRTTFVHDQCANGFFEFQGADDAWLFINGKLAMDLGGVVPNVVQHVPIDRLELTDGESCTFEFFYAQRQGANCSFNMRTNLPLESVVSYETVSAGAD